MAHQWQEFISKTRKLQRLAGKATGNDRTEITVVLDPPSFDQLAAFCHAEGVGILSADAVPSQIIVGGTLIKRSGR